MMDILPVNLPHETHLHLVYESKILNVRLVESVSHLEAEQRLTVKLQFFVSILNYFHFLIRFLIKVRSIQSRNVIYTYRIIVK